LNGLTSEATHIYDPNFNLFEAYRTLINQWREAFEIAEKNREAGLQPISLDETALLLKTYFRKKW
jgi:hypothetical protein